jgi:microcystin-dependent protein|tara:strand:- start:5089 stop:7179 length:2091 start_codon:yes stop_codon:yes gene_type:complete
MAYLINYSDSNKGTISIEDSTINQTTSLDIPGRNTTSYGSVIAESFLKLLENFSNTAAPRNPIQGQLWYDTSTGVNSLKLYDGTSWVNAGGLKKGNNAPAVSSSLTGDLWADTDNNQLYIFTGSAWTLVGPEYSDGLLTGAKPTTVTGKDEVNYTVLQIEVQGNPIAIYSTRSFSPKSTIVGFSIIQPGLNLSTANISGAGIGKYYGTAEKAENLVVSANELPVAASKFLRSDVSSTTNEQLIISNDQGLRIGVTNTIDIAVSNGTGQMVNQTQGAPLDFKIKNDDGLQKNVLRIDSNEKVGINTITPAEALDVSGSIQASNNLIIQGTTDSTSIGTGSVKISGGVGIAKKLWVGNAVNIAGTTTSASIEPSATQTYNLGSSDKRWQTVHAVQFRGDIVGNVTGTVTGGSANANKLTTASTFQLSGDVSSNQITFDGSTGGTTKVFTTAISNTFIANKTLATAPRQDDEVIINRVSGDSTGVFKISQSALVSSVPVIPIGTIVPFGGVNLPAGWLLCDGSEQRIADYLSLYNAIQFQFKDQSQVASGFFGLPDFRGRFPLGADNMGGTSANRVTDVNADTVGLASGVESRAIDVKNLPEHEHDLRSPKGAQFYVILDDSGTPQDADTIVYDAPTGNQAGQARTSSGGLLNRRNITYNQNTGLEQFETFDISELGTPYNVMNPFLTVKYIIYSGVGG